MIAGSYLSVCEQNNEQILMKSTEGFDNGTRVKSLKCDAPEGI